MSTQRYTSDARPTTNAQQETRSAPLMFATDNDHPIEGLFEAEPSDTPY